MNDTADCKAFILILIFKNLKNFQIWFQYFLSHIVNSIHSFQDFFFNLIFNF